MSAPRCPVTFHRNGALGDYTVRTQAGRTIGSVRRHEQRYSLRRAFTVRGWLAFDAKGFKVSAPMSVTGAYDTRCQAGVALLHHHQKGLGLS